MPKIKGSHTAMKSGIIAEVINDHINSNKELSDYESNLKTHGYMMNYTKQEM